MNDKIIHFRPEGKTHSGQEYLDGLKELSEKINEMSELFQVNVKNYLQDLTYLVIAEDIFNMAQREE